MFKTERDITLLREKSSDDSRTYACADDGVSERHTSGAHANLHENSPPGDASARRRALGLIDFAIFDSAALPEGERAEAYRHLLAAPGRLVPLAEPFQAHAVVYNLGDVRITVFEGVPHRFERSRAKIVFDQIDHIEIHHIVSGRVVAAFSGADRTAEEGSVYCVDMAEPATIEECGPTRSILIGLRRPTAINTLPAVGCLHGVVLDRQTAEPFLRVLHALVPKLDTLRRDDAPQKVAELLAALARCLDTSSEGPDRWADQRRAALDFIDNHVADRRLSPDFIAGSLRLSRSTLFSALRNRGGVERAIIDCRLDRARTLLLQSVPRPTVAQLAHVCGFSSPEHLSRAFRQRFGVAPSRLGASRGPDAATSRGIPDVD